MAIVNAGPADPLIQVAAADDHDRQPPTQIMIDLARTGVAHRVPGGFAPEGANAYQADDRQRPRICNRLAVGAIGVRVARQLGASCRGPLLLAFVYGPMMRASLILTLTHEIHSVGTATRFGIRWETLESNFHKWQKLPGYG